MRLYFKDMNTRQIIACGRCGCTIGVDRAGGYINLTQKTVPIKLSLGNKKYIPSDITRFLIFNLPAIATCPGATKDCIHFCYAHKAEVQYPSCKKSRENHYIQSLQDNFVDMMIVTILYWINTPNFKKAKFNTFRIHESGDFYSPEYVAKWLDIIDCFKDSKITFAAYTKSFDFFTPEMLAVRPQFALSGSLDNSSTEEAISACKKLGIQIYKAIPENEIKPAKFNHICRCADCGRCRYCFKQHFNTITACGIH